MLSDLETQGGAAVGASRLAEGFIRAGVQVSRLVCFPDGQTHSWTTQPLRGSPRERLTWRAIQYPLKRLSVSAAAGAQRLWVHPLLRRELEELKPDVISVNNLHGGDWWPTLVSDCTPHAPTVWTLHDMWSFTGRCAYSYDCRNFVSGCDASCPTPSEYPALPPRLIADSWELRRRLLASNPRLVGVCPSKWLGREALAGLWKNHRIEVIPYGLDLNIYQPANKEFARFVLGIDTPGPVLLVAAQQLEKRRKGGLIIGEALQRILHRPLTVMTMGHGSLNVEAEGIYLHSLGYVDNEKKKVMVYSGADIVVHPAPVDNLPHVVMESIACGTPVVGFPVGGVVDMIRPGETGWLAEAVTSEALASATDKALRDLHGGMDLRPTCRAVAESEYGIELQVRRYLELFRSLRASGAITP